MKTSRFFCPLTLLLLCFAVTSFAEEILYVQPFQAKIFPRAAISADILGKVDAGYRFVVTGREGRWVKLTFNGKQGFIPVVQTANSPPLAKVSAQGAETSTKLGARARTSSTSAVVAGMKGLTYEDRARITKGENSNIEALEKAESLKVTAEELEKFQAEGGKR